MTFSEGDKSARGKRILIDSGKQFHPLELKTVSNYHDPIEGEGMKLKIFIEQEDIMLIGYRQTRNAIRSQAEM